MTRCPDTIHLAVDGGGTRCRIALSMDGAIHQVEVGAANVSTNFNAACAELRRGLTLLAGQVGIDPVRFEKIPAYLGLAGITGQALADKLAAALPFRRVRIADDRASALYGALGERDGFVAHCGTGSFLAAKQAGKAWFAGGWGPVLGDQASAQWVGRLALSKTLDSTDGLTAPSAMVDHLLYRFDGSAGIVQAAANLSQTEFGALAPVVTEHAGQGDPIARSILQEAADYLSDRMSQMGWQPGLPICLTGGIAPCHASYLPAEMQADLADPLGDPLSGALTLARAFKEEIENERC